MRNFIKIFLITALSFTVSHSAMAFCTTPGSFTLNSPSSSNIYGTSINLTWGTSTNAVTYLVNYRVSGNVTWLDGGSTTGTSATLSGLSYGTTYQVKITATNICAGPPPEYEPITSQRDSNTRTITTEPQSTTTNAATSISTTSFTANWNSRTGATSYDLDVSTSSSFTSYVSGYNGLNVSSTSKSVTGLSSATRYYYRVRSVNSGGESSNSSSRTVYTIPDTPTMNDASNESQTSFDVSWGAVDRADSYRLDVSTSSLFVTYVTGYNNLTVTGTSHNVTGLTEGTTYYFRVRAYDFNGNTTSANPTAKNTITIPDEPTATAATDLTQTSFTANWDSELGATSYRLDVSIMDDFSSFVSGYQNLSVTGTSQSVIGLSNGTTYYFRLRAENANGVSSNSNEVVTLTIPGEPAVQQATDFTQTSFTANWSAETSATSYQLDVAFDQGFTEYAMGYPMFGIIGLEQSVTGLSSGKTYYYRVRAVNNSGTSGHSSSIETITIPGSPFSLPSDITASSFVAGWGAVIGASKYSIDVSTVDDLSSFVPGYENLEVLDVTQDVIGLDPGTTYFYRVNAGNTSGYSDYSPTRELITKPETPTATAATDKEIDRFTANWEAIAIEPNSYIIDVSTSEDFSSFVPGYDEKTVSTTSQSITGLSPGTIYYYRVRSNNDGGYSDNSNIIEALTSPDAPVTTAATNLSENSIQANWLAMAGASEYQLDVSTTANFAERLDGYDNITVSGTSKTVSGLDGGSTYFYRVRAKNTSGTSINSEIIETLTVPAIPIVSTATSHFETSFDAHWEAVNGVEQYWLDVAKDENFNDLVEGYEDFAIDGSLLSHQVIGLAAGTEYFYRVSAKNASGNSGHSATISTITTPAQTSITGFADHSSTKFRVSWEGVLGVDTYEIYVATDPVFNSLVDGNSPKVVQNILTETFIEGLLPNTIYYVKVSSTNTSGSATYSDIKTTSTTNSDGSVVKPSIDNLNFDYSSLKLTWSTSGGTGGITSVVLSHRKITESDFTSEEITIDQDGSYEINVEPEWMDALGMQYQIRIEDLAGRSDLTETITYNRPVQDVEIPISESFGTTVNDYQIISIPYELSTTRIQDLFEGVLGNYNKAKWRLLKYKNDETGYVDYEEGLSVSNVQRGAGYWFISSESVNLMFGDGQTPTNTIDEPFELNLTQGWNQIGNPYLEDISWADVLSANGNPETVGPLFTYNSTSAAFEENDLFRVFGGGFVFADQAIMLTIPVDINLSTSGGRLRKSVKPDKETTSGWALDFNLAQGDKTNQLSGVGMNASAQMSKDQYDVMTPPYFSDHIAMHTEHNDFFYKSFTKDIVSPRDQYHWAFNLQSNTNESVELTWDHAQIPNGSLILYDLRENALIDMRNNSSYVFTKGTQSFNIYYTKESIDLGNGFQLGKGFPNPMNHRIEIPYAFHIGEEVSSAILTIYDMQGMQVVNKTESNHAQGVRGLTWDRKNNNGGQVARGLYFFQIKSKTGNHSVVTTGKIIIK
ncbi:fibronectin type III domain-containing protein [Reichenbachiella sp.]|uniref:fibronectin type III domain-containing protein n=1 Tax=Reichenbachiella sp. TaxID=2184521 RepID=UPI003298DBB6